MAEGEPGKAVGSTQHAACALCFPDWEPLWTEPRAKFSGEAKGARHGVFGARGSTARSLRMPLRGGEDIASGSHPALRVPSLIRETKSQPWRALQSDRQAQHDFRVPQADGRDRTTDFSCVGE